MLISNDPVLAEHAVNCGVERIFIDLETEGKYERQGHRDTHISHHSIEDIHIIREAISDHELLVRLNPLSDQTADEIEIALRGGADLLMLPMFNTLEEISNFVALVDGRARVIPLVETVPAMHNFRAMLELEGIDEVFIGLNDLHQALGMNFMFEPLANGMLESMADMAMQANIPFGFGGIARIGEGLLPGEEVLAEHLRLGSSSVILSRTFSRDKERMQPDEYILQLCAEVKRLRDYELRLAKRDEAAIEAQHVQLVQHVMEIAASIARRSTG